MGAQKSSHICCGSATDGPTCWAKTAGDKGTDIVGARPVDFPGLSTEEQLTVNMPNTEGEPSKDKTEESETRAPAEGDTIKELAAQPEQADKVSDPSKIPQKAEEKYDDGSTYVGQLLNCRRHGHGVWQSKTEEYTGSWKDDQRDGQGRQTWQDGRQYEGQFRDGKFHGHGRMEWGTKQGKMVYEGQYVDDMKHGEGKYTWPDSRTYSGQWVQGKRSGRATYTNPSGESRLGIWKDDKIEKWLSEEVKSG
mmetsp:Transcript_59788/g.129511  ORF Transcript_59788/g.129511 Transcript_59788/m.129511 type:complete len:250 (-) Transcript_59788:209-958(-)